jgi:hypothetical protein
MSTETSLAERIASLSWRLNRAPRFEVEMTAHHIDAIPDDLADTASYGEKLGVPREETVSMDRIGELNQLAPPPFQRPNGQNYPLRRPPLPPAHPDHPRTRSHPGARQRRPAISLDAIGCQCSATP